MSISFSRCSILLLTALAFSHIAPAYTFVVQPTDPAGHTAVLRAPAWAGEYIDRYLRDRTAILIVTPVGPPLATAENPHPIGVFYNGSRWAVFNQDFAPMPVGAAFEVEY